MNAFDIGVAGLAVVLVVVGTIKGLVRILIGIGALIGAFFLAAHFHEALAGRLGFLASGEAARKMLAYALLLVGTLVGGVVVAFVVRKLLQAALLGWVDRLAGAALGLAAALLVAALLVLPAVAYTEAGRNMLAGSMLAPYVTVVADAANVLAPGKLSAAYRDGVARVRAAWRGAAEPAATPRPAGK